MRGPRRRQLPVVECSWSTLQVTDQVRAPGCPTIVWCDLHHVKRVTSLFCVIASLFMDVARARLSPAGKTAAVLGASGRLGTRICAHLRRRGFGVVELSRSSGTDLLASDSLYEALRGVDVAIDASRPVTPSQGDVLRTLTSASRNLAEACARAEVSHLVFVSIVGVDDPRVAEIALYRAKRAQELAVEECATPYTILRSTQWYEFATNPAAVQLRPGEARVQDWLIRPVAVDSVARAISNVALGRAGPRTLSVAGPEVMRLPDLTERALRNSGDDRPVRAVPPAVAALGEGALLPPRDALIVGPDLHAWLHASPAATRSPASTRSADDIPGSN